jgi:hypothetical protein
MNKELNRLWQIRGSDLESRLEMLYKRPRIDYRISEYVFEYIEKHILEPNKSRISYNSIDLSFVFLYNKDEKIDFCHLIDSVYNTENTKYDWDDHSEKTRSGTYRFLHLFCYSTEMNENIKPIEYANIVYDMIGAYVTNKKITKEIMDKFKIGMDYTYIERFKYPASFEDQKYDDDERNSDFVKLLSPETDGIKIKEDYIKHYGE